jgi:hypothetical protein
MPRRAPFAQINGNIQTATATATRYSRLHHRYPWPVRGLFLAARIGAHACLHASAQQPPATGRLATRQQ